MKSTKKHNPAMPSPDSARRRLQTTLDALHLRNVSAGKIHALYLGAHASPELGLSPSVVTALVGADEFFFNSHVQEDRFYGQLGKLWAALSKHDNVKLPTQKIGRNISADALAQLIEERLDQIAAFLLGCFPPHAGAEHPESSHNAVVALRDLRTPLLATRHVLRVEGEAFEDFELVKSTVLLEFTEAAEQIMSAIASRGRTLREQKLRRSTHGALARV